MQKLIMVELGCGGKENKNDGWLASLHDIGCCTCVWIFHEYVHMPSSPSYTYSPHLFGLQNNQEPIPC